MSFFFMLLVCGTGGGRGQPPWCRFARRYRACLWLPVLVHRTAAGEPRRRTGKYRLWAGWQASAAVDGPVRGTEAAASCRKWTAFPHKQAFPGRRADPQIRIFTQVHEDSVEKMFVLVEPEICAAMAGQCTTDKRIRVAGQITDDIFSHTGVFDSPDLAAELEQQSMCRFEEQPQLVLLQAAEGCRAERQILPETFAHGKGMIRR